MENDIWLTLHFRWQWTDCERSGEVREENEKLEVLAPSQMALQLK